MKIAINNCYGGFSLSNKAAALCVERGMTMHHAFLEEDKEAQFTYYPAIEEWPEEQRKWCMFEKEAHYSANHCDSVDFRTNPIVLAVIEELGEEADGMCAEIKIIDIPDSDITPDKVCIREYDGMEWVAEEHRTWS